jgi:arylsulfatase A-like enzyme
LSSRFGEALRGGLAWIAGATIGGVAIGTLVGGSLAFARGGLPDAAPPAALVALHALAVFALGSALLGLATSPAWAALSALVPPGGRAVRALRVLGLVLAAVGVVRFGAPRLAEALPLSGPDALRGWLAAAALAGLVLLVLAARRFARDAIRPVALALAVGLAASALLAGAVKLLWHQTDAPEGLAGITAPRGEGKGAGPYPSVPLTFTAPRNVILIVIDTLRADHLSCYGYARATSPSIDRLAAEGALFERAIVQKPSTSPSVATILSGTYPYTHGIYTVRDWLPDKVLTLPEMLRSRGMRTGGVVTNVNLSRAFNFQQGFDDYIEVGTTEGPSDSAPATKAALEWIEENRDEPFFLYLHYLDPHAPYTPPPPFRGTFDGDALSDRYHGPEPPIGPTYLGEIHKESVIENGSRDVDLYVQRYDEEILYVDSAIGRLLERLRVLGLEESTLVVLTSDHGESLGEHKFFFGHGHVPFEDNVRVPLILWYPPGVAGGQRVGTIVESVSIVPTVLDALRVDYPVRFEGPSLWRHLPAGAGADREAVAFIEVRKTKETLMNSIRTDRWKLIHNPAGIDLARDPLRVRVLLNPGRLERLWWAAHDGPAVKRVWELYDLQADPGEVHDLARERPEIARELWTRLAGWLALAPAERTSRRVKLEDLSPAEVETLRSLGYVR